MPDLNSYTGASSPPSLETERERLIPIIKQFRVDVDALIQKVPHGFPNPNDYMPLKYRGGYNPQIDEAYAQVRVSLTNGKMWAGKMLEALGNPFPVELADKAN